MEIRPFDIVKTQFSAPDPVIFPAAGIQLLDNHILVDAFSLAGDPDSPIIGNGHVDVQKGICGEGLLLHNLGQTGGKGGSPLKILVAEGIPGKRDGEGGHTHQRGFHGSGDRPGIGDIIPQITPFVDTGNDQIRTFFQKTVNSQVNTVRRGSVHGEKTGPDFLCA